MITVRFTQKIALNYLDSENIDSNIKILEDELISLNYEVRKENQSLMFTNRELFFSHMMKRNLPWGKVFFSKDKNYLIIDFSSKIIGVLIVGLIFIIAAVVFMDLFPIVFCVLLVVAMYFIRKKAIEKLIVKTYSKSHQNYSEDNSFQRKPALYIYLIIAIIIYLIGFILGK